MIKILFSQEQIDLLFEEKRKNEHPIVRKKAEVLYLKALEYPHGEIQKISRLSEPMLVSYMKEYIEGGIDRIREIKSYRPKSELDIHKDVIKKYFDEHPPQNSAEAGQRIFEICGLKRSPTQIRAFLKRIGLKLRKVGYVPGKQVDPEKQLEQEEFKKKNFRPID